MFCDSFEGTGVKLSLWNVNWFGKTPNDITEPITRPDEQGCYDIKQLTVANGMLTFHVDSRPGCKVTPGNQDPGYTMNYAGGIINTRGKESFTYGLMETRVRIDACPNGGFANYFFQATMGQNFPADGEIDAPEMRGQKAGYWYHSSAPTVGGSNSNPNAPGNQAGVFNTYSYEWTPDAIIWRYNGVEVFRVVASSKQPISNKPLWLHLVYNAGQSICTPATADVQYVKVWQK